VSTSWISSLANRRTQTARDSQPTCPIAWPKVINLLTDLKEERDVVAKNSWVGVPMTKIIINLEQSLKKYPPIKAGTPEPYVPPK
jgi:hypothetical protein